MAIPKPQIGPFQINLNTILNVLSLISIVGLGGYMWANTTRDIDELATWRLSHEQLHKERLVEVKAMEARNEARFTAIENETRKIDNLDYRLTVAEQATASTATTMRGLQDSLNDMNGDIRVMREILQRLDNVNGRRAERSRGETPG